MMKHTYLRTVLAIAMAMTIVLSVTGGTIAFFTDTVSTGVNTISAGNLDVALYEGKVENGEIKYSDKEVDENTRLFDESMLWEPGCTEVAYLKIDNIGTLALKYRLGAMMKDLTVGTSMLMNKEGTTEFRLSEHLKFAVVEIDKGEFFANREDALAAAQAEDASKLKYGEIVANTDAKYAAVIVYMPATVGNEANYVKGSEVPQVELGIRLEATQMAAEFDSFGDGYDINAPLGFEGEVESADELAQVLENAKPNSNNYIKLANDIAIPDGITLPESDYTIDLAGCNLTIGNAETSVDGLVVEPGATMSIKNSDPAKKATISYLGTSTGYDAIFVNGGELNIEGNVEVKANTTSNSIIHAVGKEAVVNIGKGVNIVAGGDTPNQFTGIYIESGATVNMTGGTITIDSDLTENNGWNNDVVGVMLLGDYTAFNMTGGTINVHGVNAFTQAVQIATMNDSANPSKIHITGGTFNVTKKDGSSCAFAIYNPSQGTVVIDNATFNGDYTAATMVAMGDAKACDITINGGTFAFNPSDYVKTDTHTVTQNADAGTWTVTAK